MPFLVRTFGESGDWQRLGLLLLKEMIANPVHAMKWNYAVHFIKSMIPNHAVMRIRKLIGGVTHE